jgi:carbon starvation protein
MYFLAYTNAFAAIWPIFGSSNQLLASLALIAVSAWLVKRKKTAMFIVLPAIFMMVTTLYSLVSLLVHKYLPKHNVALAVTDVALIILSIGVIVLALHRWRELRNGASTAGEAM